MQCGCYFYELCFTELVTALSFCWVFYLLEKLCKSLSYISHPFITLFFVSWYALEPLMVQVHIRISGLTFLLSQGLPASRLLCLICMSPNSQFPLLQTSLLFLLCMTNSNICRIFQLGLCLWKSSPSLPPGSLPISHGSADSVYLTHFGLLWHPPFCLGSSVTVCFLPPCPMPIVPMNPHRAKSTLRHVVCCLFHFLCNITASH